MAVDLNADFLTIAEAARLLKVSTVTIHRWIREGRLPAYHVGPRKVRIRRQDLASVIIPTDREEVGTMKENLPLTSQFVVKPLTDEQVERGLAALERARQLGEQILKRRGGKPLPSSAPLIRKAREERSRQLL